MRFGVCRAGGLLSASVFGCRVDYANTCAESGVFFEVLKAKMAARLLMASMRRLGSRCVRSLMYALRTWQRPNTTTLQCRYPCTRIAKARDLVWGCFFCVSETRFRVQNLGSRVLAIWVRGYLALKKQTHTRTLQWDYGYGLMVDLGGVRFLMNEVPL